MKLYDNWKDIVKRAWSIRFIILAGMLSGCEVVLPFFSDSIPDKLFAVLSFLRCKAIMKTLFSFIATTLP